ncbi:HipA family kinase [Roseibacillus persicicus]|uniref:HipA-like kinase domain-containing protein n=1 Tax=Roseibacillus persicicus TaxID=454148 RepID=A0A918TM20_9BACT|nr:HipA family kinase [Roseibacillus persicicus]GHC52951.1 hypothetical protein GCM10007100_19190 [Roseibacillus persicicus]
MSLRHFTALQFRQPMARGLNLPFLVTAQEGGQSKRETLVVKCHAGYGHRMELVMRELFSLLLARQLGLTTVEPVVVNLVPGLEFGAMDYRNHNGKDYVDLIERSHGPNFATVHLGSDWKQWLDTKPPQSIPKEEINAAYAFDAMVQNSDRRSDNPNLLWRGEELAMLDFDKAFSHITSLRDEDRPWRKALPMMQLSAHCLFPHLRLDPDKGLANGLWDSFEEWNLQHGDSELHLMISGAFPSSSLDFSELSAYFERLSVGVDDFFGYLTAHSFPTKQ